MSEIAGKTEIKETSTPEAADYKEIKSESDMTSRDAKDFWDNIFDTDDKNDTIENPDEYSEADNPEHNLEQAVDEYVEDLNEKSDCPETIPDSPFEASDLEKRTPEENAEMREEFDDKRAQLKKEWEDENGKTWPKYEEDVYSSNGNLIRKAGSDYDAHHIQPLCMGGKNEAGNITPLHAEVHYDKQGIHAMDSPYSKMNQIMEV